MHGICKIFYQKPKTTKKKCRNNQLSRPLNIPNCPPHPEVFEYDHFPLKKLQTVLFSRNNNYFEKEKKVLKWLIAWHCFSIKMWKLSPPQTLLLLKEKVRKKIVLSLYICKIRVPLYFTFIMIHLYYYTDFPHYFRGHIFVKFLSIRLNFQNMQTRYRHARVLLTEFG